MDKPIFIKKVGIKIGNGKKKQRRTNVQNGRLIRKNNTSGYKGVFFSRTTNKWRAMITSYGKTYHLGWFNDKIEAANAYDNWIVKNHTHHALNIKLPTLTDDL